MNTNKNILIENFLNSTLQNNSMQVSNNIQTLNIIILIIGITASIFLIIAYIPQVIKVIKTKRTDGISFLFLGIVSLACFLFVVYAILNLSFNKNKAFGTAIPLLIANFVVGSLTIAMFIFKFKNFAIAKKNNMSETDYYQKYILNQTQNKEV